MPIERCCITCRFGNFSHSQPPCCHCSEGNGRQEWKPFKITNCTNCTYGNDTNPKKSLRDEKTIGEKREQEKAAQLARKEPDMLRRYWINQPSGLQEFHRYHGKKVIVAETSIKDGWCRCAFIEGDVISMNIRTEALSPGWSEKEKETNSCSNKDKKF
jgi:hypothetical protein